MATASQSRESREAPESPPTSNVVVRPRRDRSGPELYFPDESNIKIDKNVFGGERLRWDWWATTENGRRKGGWVPDGRNYEIPTNCQYRVYTMPDNFMVLQGKASKVIRIALDKGWYRIKIKKSLMNRGMEHKRAAMAANWGFSFVAGFDEKEWQRVRNLRAEKKQTVMTSDGLRPEFQCAHDRCEEVYMTEVALAIHEREAHIHTAPRGD